jgi:RHS repeat-associated protein
MNFAGATKYFRGESTDELVAAWMYDSDGKLKPFLFHQDQVSSTTAVSGHNGGTTQSVKYSAFGTVQSSTGASPNRQKYTGREDDGTGLMYYRARMYDPVIGRFVSEDPLGFEAGDVNFYAYVANNPVNANDPSGNVKKGVEKGVELMLWAKDTWNKAQIQAAQQKVDALSKLAAEGRLVKTPVQGGPSASSIWGSAGRTKPARSDIDHIQDKQLGGTNALSNLSPLDSSVNRSFGAQIGSQLRNYPVGTAVTAVGIFFSEAANAASNVTLGDVGQFLFDASPLRDLWDAVKIKGTGGCNSSGVCSDMINWNQIGPSSSFSPAGGGFLLYPNKANTNMLQSVYSK